jgi:hypothetical protein
MERVAVVQHEDELTARDKHAAGFLQSPSNLRSVVQDAEGVHDIEALSLEGKGFSIGNQEGPRQPFEGKPLARQLNAPRAQVNACYLGARTGKLEKIGPQPAANFQNALASVPLKANEPVHERLNTVAKALHLSKKLPRSPGQLRKLRPAWLTVPVASDMVFEHRCAAEKTARN